MNRQRSTPNGSWFESGLPYSPSPLRIVNSPRQLLAPNSPREIQSQSQRDTAPERARAKESQSQREPEPKRARARAREIQRLKDRDRYSGRQRYSQNVAETDTVTELWGCRQLLAPNSPYASAERVPSATRLRTGIDPEQVRKKELELVKSADYLRSIALASRCTHFALSVSHCL